jgi:poly(beta-D-mannuronate) lyase
MRHGVQPAARRWTRRRAFDDTSSMRRRALLVFPALHAGSDHARATERLGAPFDLAAIRSAVPRLARARPCVAPPPAVTALESQGFYTDRRFSEPDPARLDADAAAARPLRGFLDAAQRGAEDWLRTASPDAAACALAAIDRWAREGALLGPFNRQAGYHRTWTLAGAATAFLAIRDAPGLETEALARASAWLGDVARRVTPVYERIAPPRETAQESRNNLATWAGFAVAAAGVAAGERLLLDWGRARLTFTLGQVNGAGALPEEVRRGRMALHYHLFSLWALAPLLRIAEANGLRLSVAEDAALARLVALVVGSIAEPERMAAIAGVPQGHLREDARFDSRTRFARDSHGLEVLQGRRLDPALERLLAPIRPFRHAWLGGPVTLLWGPRGAAR